MCLPSLTKITELRYTSTKLFYPLARGLGWVLLTAFVGPKRLCDVMCSAAVVLNANVSYHGAVARALRLFIALFIISSSVTEE